MTAKFPIDTLTPASQEFARMFLARFPEFASCCSAEPMPHYPGVHLRITVPSPAGPDRNVEIWMNQGVEPSLGFSSAGWHVHGEHLRQLGDNAYREESLLDLLSAVLADTFVLAEEIPTDVPTPTEIARYPIDLRNPEDLLDVLTSPHGANRLRLLSFSGTRDQEVSTDNEEP